METIRDRRLQATLRIHQVEALVHHRVRVLYLEGLVVVQVVQVRLAVEEDVVKILRKKNKL